VYMPGMVVYPGVYMPGMVVYPRVYNPGYERLTLRYTQVMRD